MDSARLRAQYGAFVEEMTAHREDRGWSQAKLAHECGYHESLINHVTAFRKPPSMDLAQKLDHVFKTPGYTAPTPERPKGTPGTFQRLLHAISKGAFSVPFGDFEPHEQSAQEIYVSDHSYIPGLLQTPEYARAVLSTRPNTTADELDELIESRLARQAVLTRDNPPVCWFLIDEGSLYRHMALPPEAMRAQLMHILDIAQLPNVTVNVVPYGAGGHTGLLGACIIAETPGQPAIVYLDDMADGRVTEDSAIVADVRLRWKSLASEALPVRASLDLIRKVAEER